MQAGNIFFRSCSINNVSEVIDVGLGLKPIFFLSELMKERFEARSSQRWRKHWSLCVLKIDGHIEICINSRHYI